MKKKASELMTVHNKVKELTGYDMFLFRPPYGDYNNQVVTNAKKNNYYPIQWNVDSLDWKDYGADDIVKRVTERIKIWETEVLFSATMAQNIPRMLWNRLLSN